MSTFYPDESFCTSDCSRLLIRPKLEWPASVKVVHIEERKHVTGTRVDYVVEIQFTPPDLTNDVRRFSLVTRYKELNKLHFNLLKLHKQLFLRGIFPSFPPKKFIGSTNPDVVKERKNAIDIFLTFVCESNVLRKTCVFLKFCEQAIEHDNKGARDEFNGRHDSSNNKEDTDSASFLNFNFPNVAIDGITESTENLTKSDSILTTSLPSITESSTGKIMTAQDHLLKAAEMVAAAQRVELEGEYELAFHSYKNATHYLIQAALLEQDISKQNVIRRKTAKYLMKAEKIYKFHLSYDGSFGLPTKIGALQSKEDPNILAFKCSNNSLKNFNIIGVLPDVCSIKRVILVEDPATGVKSVIKFMEKRDKSDGQLLLPTGVPHMVQLKRFFETDVFIILLLEHIEYGLLWNFLARFFYERELEWQVSLNDVENAIHKNIDVKPIKLPEAEKYAGRKLTFSVCADINRYVNVSSNSYVNEDPGSCELLCSMGEDCTAQGSNAGDFYVVSTIESVDVGEEDPATPNFSKSIPNDHSRITLSHCLSEVKHLLLLRRSWPSCCSIPESIIVHWMAQLISWFYVMHTEYQIYIGTFSPDHVLLAADGNIVISYYGKWRNSTCRGVLQEGYAAPESFSVSWVPNEASDIWTIGAILFELLTGRSLASAVPHLLLQYHDNFLPNDISIPHAGQHLLSQMLCSEVSRIELDVVRAHSFFSSIDWNLYDNPNQSSASNFLNSNTEQSIAVPNLNPSDLLELPNNRNEL